MPAALLGFVAATFLVGVICSSFHHDVVRVFEARERLRHGAVLLDVDHRGEFALRHPRTARNIPLEELARRADELGSKETSVVVYAHRWRDGLRAVHLLRSLGFREVYDAAGVRVREQLSDAAARAERAKVEREQRRGIPSDVEVAGST